MLVVEIRRAEILTHQLFTCKMVRPVSAASCFFCSSEGYGCCRNKHRNIYTRVSLSDVQINVNIHTCLRSHGATLEGSTCCKSGSWLWLLTECIQYVPLFVVLCNPRLHLFLTSNQPCFSLPCTVHACIHTHTCAHASARRARPKPVRAG